MIQIYSPGNTTFTSNGDMVLIPTECEQNSVLCGTWEVTLKHPRDDEGRWKYIVEGAVISAPTFMGDNQLFRIFEVVRTHTDVTAYARPIFFDSADDVFLFDTRPTNLTGQQALNYVMNGTAYTGESDITTVTSAYYVRKNLIEALNGDEDNSFINRWGGEPLYRNHHVIFNQSAGDDNGVQVRYRKNISSIEETVNTDELITRIVPIAYNGRLMNQTQQYIDSPLINSYPKIYTKLVKFENIKLAEDVSGDPSDGDEICQTETELTNALAVAVAQMFSDGCDKPKVTLDIDMVDLAQTDEYKDYAVLETIRLGDTVHCIHNDLEIDTTARVTQIKWDCIHNCVNSVVLGDVKYDYFDNLQNTLTQTASAFNDDGDIMAERITGVLNLLKTNLKYQKNVAQRSDVRAILFEDLDTTSPTFGALCIGTQGIQISHQRNTYDTDWVWGTAIDFQTIYANYVIAGTLTDAQGNNSWNLDTGVFSLHSGTKIDDSSTNTIGSLDTRISTNASSISTEITNRQAADTSLSTQITQTASSINSTVSQKVGKDEIISQINQSAESIKINAAKINLNGAVTMNSTGKKSITVDAGALALVDQSVVDDSNGTFITPYATAGWITAIKDEYKYYDSSDDAYDVYVGEYVADLSITFYSHSNFVLRYGTSATATGGKVMEVFGNESGRVEFLKTVDVQAELKASSLTVRGTKSRVVDTADYANRLLYSYETPSPMFGDIGEGVIDADGYCYVPIDPVFAETVTLDNYQVFLQAYGSGSCYVSERHPGYFVVCGEAGLTFGWELKAKQAGYDDKRLDNTGVVEEIETEDYGALAIEYIDSIEQERRSA